MENQVSQKKTYTAGLVLGILSIPCGLLIAISGLIFLYIALEDEDLNVELAFN